MPAKPHSGLVMFGTAAALLFLLAYPGLAQTSAPPPQTETTRKQSIIYGRVIYEDTRRPLRRVHVSIYDPAAKNRLRGYFAWTDGRGEFQIKDVVAGNYFVVVDAPGIIRKAPYNADNKDETFASVTVDGTSKSEVVVRVRRGAAISGRITYADGDPAIEIAIKVLRKNDGRWTPVSVNTGSNDRALTDDRGVYRVAGLEPGEYIVGAAEQKWGIELSAQDRPDGGNYLNRAVLPATYYNGVTSLSGATPIRVQAGDEQKDIDIVLVDRPMHTISGSVTLKDNSRPVVRARIGLKRKDDASGFDASDLEDPVTNTDENGRFVLNEIPDGVYRLTVSPPRWFSREQDSPTGAELGQRFVAKTIEANVSGVDLPDLAIEVTSGSRISGTVTVEGGKPVPPQLLVYVTTPKTAAEGLSQVRISPDATFSIDGVPPGPAYMRTAVPLEKHYYTKAVSVGKTDLVRGPLMVKEGEDVANVNILISPDVAVFSGRVLGSDGKTPQGGINVVLISTDPEEQKANYRVFGNTNADGGFSLMAAPGEYLALVMPRGEYAYQFQIEILKLRYPNAQRVRLQSGENPKIELALSKE